MTRAAHKVDKQATQAARYQDKRSYTRLDGHQFLFGEDVRLRREEVWKRCQGFCEYCGTRMSWQTFHMHHIQGGNVGRCTCLDNLKAICRTCHQDQHVSVRWSDDASHAG